MFEKKGNHPKQFWRYLCLEQTTTMMKSRTNHQTVLRMAQTALRTTIRTAHRTAISKTVRRIPRRTIKRTAQTIATDNCA